MQNVHRRRQTAHTTPLHTIEQHYKSAHFCTLCLLNTHCIHSQCTLLTLLQCALHCSTRIQPYSCPQHNTGQQSTTQHSTEQHNAEQYSTAQYRRAQHSIAHTVQNSEAQNRTAQHSQSAVLRDLQHQHWAILHSGITTSPHCTLVSPLHNTALQYHHSSITTGIYSIKCLQYQHCYVHH